MQKTIKFNAPPLDHMEVFNACAGLMMNEKKTRVDKASSIKYLENVFCNQSPNIHLDFKDGAGPNWTPLMFACYYEFKEGVKVLLELGADPNLTMFKDGKTVLEMCAVNLNKDITEMLLSANADANYQDVNGKNFLLTSIESKGKKADKYLESILQTDKIDLNANAPKDMSLEEFADSIGNINGSIIINHYSIKKMMDKSDNSVAIADELIPDLMTDFKL